MLHFIKKLIRTFVLSILDIEIKFKKNERRCSRESKFEVYWSWTIF